jgi:O-antigen/teichoic acid export membrane protein
LYSVAAGIVGIAQALRDFGVSNFIIQAKDLSRDQLATAIGLSLGLGLILMTASTLGSGAIAAFYSDPSLRTVVLVLSLNFLLVPYAGISAALFVRDMNFRAIMLISFAATTVGAVSSVTLAAMGWGALGMAWSSVLAIITSLIISWFLQWRRMLVLPRMRAWRELLHFGAFASGASILNMLAGKVPDIVIGRQISMTAVGIFSRGNGVITLFETALMGGVSRVTGSLIATCSREGQQLRPLFLQSLSLITAVAWPFLVLLGLLAHSIILILFGMQWVESIAVAQILCAAAATGTLGAICFTLFSATGAVRQIFHIQLATVLVHVVGVFIGSCFGLRWAACGFVASNALTAVLALAAANKDLGTTWMGIAAALRSSAVLALATSVIPGLFVFGQGFDDNHLWVPTLLTGSGGAASWVACLFAIRHPFRLEITSAIGKMRHAFAPG